MRRPGSEDPIGAGGNSIKVSSLAHTPCRWSLFVFNHPLFLDSRFQNKRFDTVLSTRLVLGIIVLINKKVLSLAQLRPSVSLLAALDMKHDQCITPGSP